MILLFCSFCLDAKEPKDQDLDQFAKIQNKSLNIFETRALLFQCLLKQDIPNFWLDPKVTKDQDWDQFAKIQNKSLNIFETRALLFQCLLKQENVWFVASLQTTVFIFNFFTPTAPKSKLG